MTAKTSDERLEVGDLVTLKDVSRPTLRIFLGRSATTAKLFGDASHSVWGMFMVSVTSEGLYYRKLA